MNVSVLKSLTPKVAGLLFVLGCVTTVLLSHHAMIAWWQQIASRSRFTESSAAVQRLQQQRQIRLQDACLARNDSWPENGQILFVVSHELRAIFCVVGKVSSTSWLRVLLRLTGNSAAQFLAATDRSSIHYMSRFYLPRMLIRNSTSLTTAPLKDYYKFMFVREPLERLISAYRDKMFREYGYIRMRQYIISHFRRHPKLTSLVQGDDVKFEEFVQYVTEEAILGVYQLDHHWRPQYHMCLPCHVNYDFIGHYETLNSDAEYVLAQITRSAGANHSTADAVRFPYADVDSRNRNSHEFLQKFYGNVSSYSILRLLRLYKTDYEVFDYDIPVEILRILNIQS